jgi:hypothetical protein
MKMPKKNNLCLNILKNHFENFTFFKNIIQNTPGSNSEFFLKIFGQMEFKFFPAKKFIFLKGERGR